MTQLLIYAAVTYFGPIPVLTPGLGMLVAGLSIETTRQIRLNTSRTAP